MKTMLCIICKRNRTLSITLELVFFKNQEGHSFFAVFFFVWFFFFASVSKTTLQQVIFKIRLIDG